MLQRFIQRFANILDRAPEDLKADVRLYELNRRILWFIVFRFAVVVVFVTIAIAGHRIIPFIKVPYWELFVLALVLCFANMLFWSYYKKAVSIGDLVVYLRILPRDIHLQVIVDFLVLGYLVYLFGGIESPLVYFFLFHSVIVCLFFKKSVSLMYTLIGVAIVYFITIGETTNLLPVRHFLYNAKGEAISAFQNKIVYPYYLAGILAVYLVVWFFVSSITDSLKLHEKRLQDKINQLVEVNKEKTRYMLATTHELKAPFASIQSYVDVILGGYVGEIPEKAIEILRKIKARCEILMKMIIAMLQLANISSLQERGLKVAKANLDIVDAMEKTVIKFRDEAEKKGVDFNFIGAEKGLYKIYANAEQIEILFNNILSNAVRYCYPNTTIVLEVARKREWLLVSVADRGMGIKKENMPNVFLELFRSEKAVEINKDSTGLGLSIAKKIMEMHGGKIWIQSEENIGTTVFMQFSGLA